MSEFSNKLQALREAKGWSKTYVSKQLGLKPRVIQIMNMGQENPTFRFLRILPNCIT